jgi:hypothetical protein
MPQISTKYLSHTTACAVALVVLLFVYPARVAAIPISEYQQNLNDAIVALEELFELEEDEDVATSDYETHLNETLAGIRATLPSNQTVESDEEVYNVDNAWLHKAIDELRQEASRSERIEQIIASLKAMVNRVAERQNATKSLESKDAAKNRLQGILKRPEYDSALKGPNALSRLWRNFIEWLRNVLPKPRMSQPGPVGWLAVVAKILVVLAGLALLVFLIKILTSRFRRSQTIKPRKKKEARIVLGERLEPEQTATDLLSEAEALARSGDLRAAIRKAYIALLVELGDRKIISLAQHKTNRDYLNSLRQLPPLHSRMSGLTESFERHWYGFVETSQTDWQNFREGYLAALQRGN